MNQGMQIFMIGAYNFIEGEKLVPVMILNKQIDERTPDPLLAVIPRFIGTGSMVQWILSPNRQARKKKGKCGILRGTETA